MHAGSEIDLLHPLAFPDVFTGAGFDHRTEMQHRNIADHVEHHVHVVLDQQDGERRIEALQEFRHLARFARGKPGRRLVEEEELRVAGEPEHDLDLALLAVRQVADLGLAPLPVAGGFEQPPRLVRQFLVGRPAAST